MNHFFIYTLILRGQVHGGKDGIRNGSKVLWKVLHVETEWHNSDTAKLSFAEEEGLDNGALLNCPSHSLH